MTAKQLSCVLTCASQHLSSGGHVGWSIYENVLWPEVQTITAALAGPGCAAGSETLLREREAEVLEQLSGKPVY